MAQQLSAPVSRVPWVVREPSNQALEDSRFYTEILSSEDKQKTATNRKLYSLINNAFFPLYLPSRYHSMDCVAIKSETNVEGHYWTHASHFLLTSQVHGVFLWRMAGVFGSEPTLAEDLDLLPQLTTNKKSEMFKDGLELSKSSSEFLLNPWVLMQLPWHPVLLLQWTAGVLTMLNMVRLELVELYRWPIPSHQHRTVVKKLFEVIDELHGAVFKLCLSSSLMELHFEMACKPEVYCQAGQVLSRLTTCLLPLVEFVASGKALEIARALKRMVYGSNFKIKKNSSSFPFVPMESFEWENVYNCVFSDQFWKQGNSWEIIGTPFDSFNSEHIGEKIFNQNSLYGSEKFIEDTTPEWIARMEKKYGKAIDPKKIFDQLEHLISAGVITNICKKDVMSAISCDKVFFNQSFYRLMELKANTDGGLRDEDAGVIYDVLYTRTKFRIADIECAMVFKIFQYCFSAAPGQHQLQALNTEGPEIDLRHIRSTLANIENLIKRKNINQGRMDLKKSVPTKSRRRVNQNEQCPNLQADGAKQVAKEFEDRIQRIVFNMFHDHEVWSQNDIKIHPDWQFVQYILPCFVASFLEFSDNGDVEPQFKENYVKIVHELIKSFEVKPFLVANMKGPYPGGYSAYQLRGFASHDLLRWQMNLLHTGLHKALGSTPQALKVSEIFKKNFLSVLLDFTVIPNVMLLNSMVTMWGIQVSRFFGRLLEAFAAAVPDSLPNLRVLEMTSMANVCTIDHFFRFKSGREEFIRDCEELDIDPVIEMVRYGALLKAQRLLGVENFCLDMSYDKLAPLQQRVLTECKRLSLEQLVAVLMFNCTEDIDQRHIVEFKNKLRMPMDRVEEIFFAYKNADQVKVCLLLGKMFTRYGINFSEISYDFAKKVAPVVYERALAQVKQDGRVQMQPCKLTLLPIKHCRWCGLVDNDVLKLCKECQSDRKFSFRTWFCSDECERLAMDLLHREEHARHLCMAIGIEKLGTRAELETAAAKGKDKRRKKKSGEEKRKIYVQFGCE